jgi:hypothetical protein
MSSIMPPGVCLLLSRWAESVVNSLVAKLMVKNQQMRWSQSDAHLMPQVRTAMMNGILRQRLREQPQITI